MAYPRQTSNGNDSNDDYQYQYTFSTPSQSHLHPQSQPQTQTRSYQHYVDVLEPDSYTQSYKSPRNVVSVPNRSSYKPISANTSSHRSAPTSNNGYQALQTSSRETPNYARAASTTSTYDKSDYGFIRNSGWENKEQFKLSYDLKPWYHEDVREAGQILDKFRKMDAQKEREEWEQQSEQREQRRKVYGGGGGYIPVPVDGARDDHEYEDDDGDYIDDSGRGDDMISPRYNHDPYVAQPAAREVEPPIECSGPVHNQEDEDEYDDGAIESCEQDAGEMIGGGGDNYGDRYDVDEGEDEFADDYEDDYVEDDDDDW